MTALPSEEPLPQDLNPGIRRTVTWLRGHGFATCDSGDGETHAHSCDRGYPYVSVLCDAAHVIDECHRLAQLLGDAGIDLVPLGHGLDGAGRAIRPCIQATYDPAVRVALIDLMGLRDAMLPASLP